MYRDFGGEQEYVPPALKRLRRFLDDMPESAVKDLRGSRSQQEIATKSGITQALVSEIEQGRRKLTPQVAARVAPVLGVEPRELLAAEQIGELRRAAMKGELRPHALMKAILELDEAMPEGRYADELIEGLVETFEEVVSAASLKAGEEPHRDHHGRRIAKPHDPIRSREQQEADENPRRDAAGFRLNKPHDPRRGGR